MQMVQTELRLVVDNRTKLCGACKVPKLTSEFFRLGDDRFQGRCKACSAANMRSRRERPVGEGDGAEGGMTYKQVAEVLGITPEGVRQIEIRALRKLRANAKVMRAIRGILDGRD